MVSTFLPYPDFAESCRVLDTVRLGKQRSEIKIILAALTGVRFKRAHGEHGLVLPDRRGYQNHAITRMWEGHEYKLAELGVVNCKTWADRYGHDYDTGKGADTLADMFSWQEWLLDIGGSTMLPSWFGDERVHNSHRSVLLSKDPDYYAQYGWDVPAVYEYYYPR